MTPEPPDAAILVPHRKAGTVTSQSLQRSSELCPKQPVPPPAAQPCPLQDSPSESMLFKAVGGMMDTLYWPRGHLLPKSSLQAL